MSSPYPKLKPRPYTLKLPRILVAREGVVHEKNDEMGECRKEEIETG
jgi:hypothetical protein